MENPCSTLSFILKVNHESNFQNIDFGNANYRYVI